MKTTPLIISLVLLSGLGVTSAMAKCGGFATAKPVMKCGAGKCGGSMMAKPMSKSSSNMLLHSEIRKVNSMKCGAAKKAVFLNIAKLKKEMAKEQIRRAGNMKCGASKKTAIMHAKSTQQQIIKATNMKCGSSKKAAIMAVKVN